MAKKVKTYVSEKITCACCGHVFECESENPEDLCECPKCIEGCKVDGDGNRYCPNS